MDYHEDLPLNIKRRRNSKEDLGRIINLLHENLIESKRTNDLLMDLLAVPPIEDIGKPASKRDRLPEVPSFLTVGR